MAMSYVSQKSASGAFCARKHEQNREYGGPVCRIDSGRFFTDLLSLGTDWRPLATDCPGLRGDSGMGVFEDFFRKRLQHKGHKEKRKFTKTFSFLLLFVPFVTLWFKLFSKTPIRMLFDN